jgi:hypothetical protein
MKPHHFPVTFVLLLGLADLSVGAAANHRPSIAGHFLEVPAQLDRAREGTSDWVRVDSEGKTSRKEVANLIQITRQADGGPEVNAPADNQNRTLPLYVTARRAQGLLQATAGGSSGGVGFYADTSLRASGAEARCCYVINYTAPDGSRPLVVRWKTLSKAAADGHVDIEGATLQTRATNAPPVVRVSRPRPDEAFALGASMEPAVEAHDPDGRIERVEFNCGSLAYSAQLGVATRPPFSLNRTNIRHAIGPIIARAYDDAGQATDSAAMWYCVTNYAAPSAAPAAVPRASALISPHVPDCGTEAVPLLVELPNGDVDADGTAAFPIGKHPAHRAGNGGRFAVGLLPPARAKRQALALDLRRPRTHLGAARAHLLQVAVGNIRGYQRGQVQNVVNP